MLRLLALAFALAASLCAQQHELGLTLGGVMSQQRGSLHLGNGTALQANYGYRVVSAEMAALYLETHFVANGARDIQSLSTSAGRNIATLYVTPGLRLKFFPNSRFSPYVAAGAGYALYEQSTTTLAGKPNPAPRHLNRGAFDFGAGIDTPLWRFVSLRAEVRDFCTGNPAFNTSVPGTGQHNVIAGGGLVLRLGSKTKQKRKTP